jgi:hypothetical protein
VDLPRFTGSGLLRMPNVGDQITFESPYFIRGHTGFMTTMPGIATATAANFHIEYQIDHGSGYGAWKTAYRRTATAVADGTSGAFTVTGLDGTSADNWIANGDIVQTNSIGVMNRAARVVSGGGTTTLTVDKAHNGGFTNALLDVFSLANENASINYETGFKLKIRITALIAGTGATNTLGALSFRTLTTAASRQITYPLDSVTLTISASANLAGSEIRIYDLDNSPVGSLGAELSGTESATGATYSFVGNAGNTVWVQIMKSGYEEFGQQVVMPSTNGDFFALLRRELNT